MRRGNQRRHVQDGGQIAGAAGVDATAVRVVKAEGPAIRRGLARKWLYRLAEHERRLACESGRCRPACPLPGNYESDASHLLG